MFPEATEPTGPAHFAFQAADREMVDRAYRAGLEAGGTDDGTPGNRRYHPGYYAAFLLNLENNYVEVVHHGPAKRSVASVELEIL